MECLFPLLFGLGSFLHRYLNLPTVQTRKDVYCWLQSDYELQKIVQIFGEVFGTMDWKSLGHMNSTDFHSDNHGFSSAALISGGMFRHLRVFDLLTYRHEPSSALGFYLLTEVAV